MHPDTGFSLHPGTTPPQPNHTVTPTHIVPEQYNPWNNSTNKSQAPEDGCINIRNMLRIKLWNKKASDIKLVSLYSTGLLVNAADSTPLHSWPFHTEGPSNKHLPLTTSPHTISPSTSSTFFSTNQKQATCYKVTEPENVVTNRNKMPGISGYNTPLHY